MMTEYDYERQGTSASVTSDDSSTSTSRSSSLASSIISISSPLSVSRKHNNPLSSVNSVSSKYSRSSRQSRKSLAKNAPELGDSLLTSALSDDYGDHGDYRGDGINNNSTRNGHGAYETNGAIEGNGALSPSSNGGSNGRSRGGFAEDDPFYIFRGDLVKKLLLAEEELRRYLNVVRTTDTAVNTHQIKEIKKQLKRHLKHAESTLSDLETTVRVVEKSREKFPHISDDELSERRNFVSESKHKLSKTKGEMQSEGVKEKFVRDERALAERRKSQKSGNVPLPGTVAKVAPYDPNKNERNNNLKNTNSVNNFNNGDEAYLEEGRSETLLIMKQQDQTLDSLDQAVTRVGHMAETIHDEIGQQNIMLSHLEDDLADAEEQLGMVMGKLAKLLKTKNKCQLGLIVILSLIVLLLFFLVLYT